MVHLCYWRRSLYGVGIILALLLLGGCGVSGTTGANEGGTPNKVTVTPDKQRYSPGDTMSVTIVNGLSTDIVAPNHQSNCTVVTLEWWSGTAWQPQNLCKLMIATRLIPIAAGATTTQQLRPPASASSGWASGTYRIAFKYFTGHPGSMSGSETTVYSASFSVG